MFHGRIGEKKSANNRTDIKELEDNYRFYDHMLNTGVDINYFYPVTFSELVENNRRFKEMAAKGENPGVTGDLDD